MKQIDEIGLQHRFCPDLEPIKNYFKIKNGYNYGKKKHVLDG